MKKFLFTAVFLFITTYVFTQQPVVAVFPFEILDNAVTQNESFQLYLVFSNEFRNRSPNSSTVVPREDVDRLITAEMDFQLTVFSAQEKTAELMRVKSATQIISGKIGRMGDSITLIVSLYTYPDLDQLTGGASMRTNTAVELFDRIPELVQNMQNIIAAKGTDQSIPEGLDFEIVDGRTVTITMYLGDAAALNIPSRIAGLPVTSITYIGLTREYFDYSSLTSVTIPSTVTYIEEGAFFDCPNLSNITVDNSNPVYASIDGVLFDKNVRTLITYPAGRNQRTYVIPSSVTSIEDYAFFYCSSLTSITIPSSVTSIGYSAFNGCGSLTSFTVDNRNTAYASIDGVLFDKNMRTLIIYPVGKNQRNYVIPSSVTSIGEYAFEGCENLTSVTIPSSVTSIGEYAFSFCYSLTSVTIPSSVTEIKDYAFFQCSSLTSVTIPSSVTSIGEGAFGDCGSLTSVTISSSVRSIGDYAFSGCRSLTSIIIPSSVRSIGDYAFGGCSSLTSITVDNSNPSYASIDGVLFDKSIQTIILYPEGKTARTYTIPSSVRYIGEGAFSSCDNLTNVTIPSSVTSIGDSAFGWCSGLTSITVDNRNTAYASIDGVLFDKSIQTIISYPAGKTARTYTIPSSVRSIGVGAFGGCNNLTRVTIPSSVTSIGDSAFLGCESLTSITIPSSVTSIGDYAFAECYNLASITIPASVRSIGEGAFMWCESLESVTLSRRTRVGEDAFNEWVQIIYSD